MPSGSFIGRATGTLAGWNSMPSQNAWNWRAGLKNSRRIMSKVDLLILGLVWGVATVGILEIAIKYWVLFKLLPI